MLIRIMASPPFQVKSGPEHFAGRVKEKHEAFKHSYGNHVLILGLLLAKPELMLKPS